MTRFQMIVTAAYVLASVLFAYTAVAMFAMTGSASAADVAGISVAAELRPYVSEIVSILIAAAIAWVAAAAKKRFGIDMQSKHRDALHTALTTGSLLAIDRKLTGDEARRLVLDYLHRSVPDALRALAPGAGVLADLVDARLAWLRSDAGKAA